MAPRFRRVSGNRLTIRSLCVRRRVLLRFCPKRMSQTSAPLSVRERRGGPVAAVVAAPAEDEDALAGLRRGGKRRRNRAAVVAAASMSRRDGVAYRSVVRRSIAHRGCGNNFSHERDKKENYFGSNILSEFEATTGENAVGATKMQAQKKRRLRSPPSACRSTLAVLLSYRKI